MFLLIVIGETIAPNLTQYAENERSIALGQESLSVSKNGFWIRDGDNFINVEDNIDGNLFNKITIIEVNNFNKIERVIKSERAVFDRQALNMGATNIFSIDCL